MPRKGVSSICFSPKTMSFAASPARSSIRSALSTPRRSFTESTMDQVIDNAAAMIMKWSPDSTTPARVTSLFYESRREAMRFLKCVNDLQRAMHVMAAEDSSSEKLIESQNLMQIAMKRLQKEFYQILSTNRARLDPESVSRLSTTISSRASTSTTSEYLDEEEDDSITEVQEVSTVAMSDLRAIAECMIASGYAKECVNVYKIIRKSIIDEGIYKLRVERLSSSQIKKLDWESLDLKMKNWLEAVKISMTTLFTGERILCDHVFSVSDSIRESVFTDISKEGAALLFGFPELVAKIKKSKSSTAPERIFRLLDMYSTISESWKEIESIFSFQSTSVVRSQALSSLIKLSESIHSELSDFEATLQKDSSRLTTAHGGGVHSLTYYAMDYLTILSDYSLVLTDIISDWPPPAKSWLPESYFDSQDSDDPSASAISVRFAWLILVLLCKLDQKAKQYKNVAISYMFLANNLHYVISNLRTSNIQYILGEEWIRKHEAKVRQFAANYERLAWGPVIESLPEINSAAVISPEEAKETFRRFNSSFEEAFKKQSGCVVPDPELRNEIVVSLARKVIPSYRVFYGKHRVTLGSGEGKFTGVLVRYSPEDIGNYLSDLFFGTIIDTSSSPSTSTSTSVSSPDCSSHRRRPQQQHPR